MTSDLAEFFHHISMINILLGIYQSNWMTPAMIVVGVWSEFELDIALEVVGVQVSVEDEVAKR